MLSFEWWIACHICSVNKLISCFERKMESPEFCYRLSVSERYSFIGLFIYRMVTCVPYSGMIVQFLHEIFPWKASKTAVWLKLQALVCSSVRNAKLKGNLQAFRIRICQVSLMMLYKLNYPISELAALPGLRTWIILDILHVLGIQNTCEANKGKLRLNRS